MAAIEIIYLPVFLKRLKKLEPELREEVLEKVELFKDDQNHDRLRVHKLHGVLAGRYGFSVNYKVRIVFTRVSKTEVAFLDIGDHDVYK